jgi:hypothetical protein
MYPPRCAGFSGLFTLTTPLTLFAVGSHFRAAAICMRT